MKFATSALVTTPGFGSLRACFLAFSEAAIANTETSFSPYFSGDMAQRRLFAERPGAHHVVDRAIMGP